MNFELKKQLSVAGFPLKTCTNILSLFHICGKVECDNYPTLSELIEACGEKFQNLWKVANEKKYISISLDIKNGLIVPAKYKGEGSTPEEAVARLWLALNKK